MRSARALDELREATAQGARHAQGVVPERAAEHADRTASTAMQQRLDAMLAAVRIVRPALDTFYQSLNDEQKARFNALGPDDDRRPASGAT